MCAFFLPLPVSLKAHGEEVESRARNNEDDWRRTIAWLAGVNYKRLADGACLDGW